MALYGTIFLFLLGAEKIFAVNPLTEFDRICKNLTENILI